MTITWFMIFGHLNIFFFV